MQEVTFENFKAWLDSKDPEVTFDASNAYACMGFQFLKDIGAPISHCGIMMWHDTNNSAHRFPEAIEEAIRWAYGHDTYHRVPFGEVQEHLKAKELANA